MSLQRHMRVVALLDAAHLTVIGTLLLLTYMKVVVPDFALNPTHLDVLFFVSTAVYALAGNVLLMCWRNNEAALMRLLVVETVRSFICAFCAFCAIIALYLGADVSFFKLK